MQTMFTRKRQWMYERGISDFLADEINRSLLMNLASSQPIAFEPVVATLDVAGQTAAVSFGTIHGNRHYSLISSIHPDEKFRPFTPGDILFRHVLKFMCDSGVEHFDLGFGTTVPKEQYADHRFRMFHTLVPLTVPGRTLVAALRCQLAVKRLVKETSPLWTLFQRARSVRGAVQGVFVHTSG